MKLSEEEFEPVTAYVHWLYKRAIPNHLENRGNEDQYEQQCYIHLSKLYALGERAIDCEFQNRVIDAIVATRRAPAEGIQYNPIGEAVNIIYENTTRLAPARKLMVQIWYDYGRSKWLTQSTAKLNHDFMEDVMSALLGDGKRGDSLSTGVPSAYYKTE